MHFLLVCSLGMAALAVALWAIERGRAGAGAPAPAALELVDPARTAAAMAAAETFGAGPATADCLCNQCEQAPVCALTFPGCVQARSTGPGSMA